MWRCLELARLGAGQVAPNPMVGAVLVYKERIIGEGYHQRYGEAHAEVNCIASVGEADLHLISQSTIYVSLEPCAHFGKTPPCANLIIQQRIARVVIGCRDPFKEVNGKGIGKLQAAGIIVEWGVLEKECKEINKRFFTFQLAQRPYIILKWAETADGFIGTIPQNSLPDELAGINERLHISNEYSNRLVHKWRSEEAAILVGTNTALLDNPELTNRLWSGNSPKRLVTDMDLRLPGSLKILDGTINTIVFNSIKEGQEGLLRYYKLNKQEDFIQQLLNALHLLNIQSVLVEGGAKLLQSFIERKCWDELRVISNNELALSSIEGDKQLVRSPFLPAVFLSEELKLESDIIKIYKQREG